MQSCHVKAEIALRALFDRAFETRSLQSRVNAFAGPGASNGLMANSGHGVAGSRTRRSQGRDEQPEPAMGAAACLCCSSPIMDVVEHAAANSCGGKGRGGSTLKQVHYVNPTARPAGARLLPLGRPSGERPAAVPTSGRGRGQKERLLASRRADRSLFVGQTLSSPDGARQFGNFREPILERSILYTVFDEA